MHILRRSPDPNYYSLPRGTRVCDAAIGAPISETRLRPTIFQREPTLEKSEINIYGRVRHFVRADRRGSSTIRGTQYALPRTPIIGFYKKILLFYFFFFF